MVTRMPTNNTANPVSTLPIFNANPVAVAPDLGREQLQNIGRKYPHVESEEDQQHADLGVLS